MMKNISLFLLFLGSIFYCSAQDFRVGDKRINKKVSKIERLLSVDLDEFTTINIKFKNFEICRQSLTTDKAECTTIKNKAKFKMFKSRMIGIQTKGLENPRAYYVNLESNKLAYYYIELDVDNNAFRDVVLIGKIDYKTRNRQIPSEYASMYVSENSEYVGFVVMPTINTGIPREYEYFLTSLHLESGEMTTKVNKAGSVRLNRSLYYISNDGIFYETTFHPKLLDADKVGELTTTMYEGDEENPTILSREVKARKFSAGIIYGEQYDYYYMISNSKSKKHRTTFHRIQSESGNLKESIISLDDAILQRVIEKEDLIIKDIYTISKGKTYIILRADKQLLFGKIENNKVTILYNKKVDWDDRYELALIHEINDTPIFMYFDDKVDEYIFETNYDKLCINTVDESTDKIKPMQFKNDLSDDYFSGRIESISTSFNHKLLVLFFRSDSYNRNLIFITPTDFNEVQRM